MTFEPFPKMARLFRDIQITEKIDGTNSQVFIWDENADVLQKGTSNQFVKAGPPPDGIPFMARMGDIHIAAGSSNRWLTIEKDNSNFARWVCENDINLAKLGHGRHFGEWWGSGIQRGYGLQNGEKRFSLFNAIRWCRHDCEPEIIPSADPRVEKRQERAPECCDVVPVLYWGLFSEEAIREALSQLKNNGSKAAPGFKHPEGIITYHLAANIGFKTTLEGDAHKG